MITEMSNSEIDITSRAYDDIVVFHCHPEFFFHDGSTQRSITCGEDGDWSHDIGICEGTIAYQNTVKNLDGLENVFKYLVKNISDESIIMFASITQIRIVCLQTCMP